MATDYKAKWNDCLAIIRDNVGDDKFNIWFRCAEAVEYIEESNELTISLPSDFFRDKYEDPDAFYNIVAHALVRVFGPSVRLSYVIGLIQGDDQSMVKYTSSPQSRSLSNKTARGLRVSPDPSKAVTYEDIDPQLNFKYNFDNYCVGNSNRLVHTIADYISTHPDKSEFNPFFLFGDVGVGKTHLIQAIGIRMKEQNPMTRVLYITMRHFINQYRNISAIKDQKEKTNAQIDFINWYQHLDVLLIDDIQELSGKEGTMNALFPIFNHLHQNNKKLIFTCDRPPAQLEGLTDRLIDRFKWGITECLPKPDLDLRRKILEFKSRKNGLQLPQSIIDMVAETATGSVRELEGIVVGIITRAINLNTPITEKLARDVIRHSVKTREKSITFDMIVEITADHYNLNTDVIYSKSRMRDIADARQMIMYLAHKHTRLSSPAIGQRLNREHATVLHGVKNVAARLSIEKDLQEKLESIETDLLS